MTKPLVVSIPHRLGQQEATDRLKHGLARATEQFGQIVQINEEVWTGSRLAFRVTALQQQASGTIDVQNDHVRTEVMLPWLLARLATGIQDTIRKRGALLLEKRQNGS
jgi:Putative polyhydroxyalkanoic acid system protein (PHA_gran_rgn)